MQIASILRRAPAAAFGLLPSLGAIAILSPSTLRKWWEDHAYERAVVGAWWNGVEPPPPPAPAAPPEGAATVAGGWLSRFWARHEPTRRRIKDWWNGVDNAPASAPAPTPLVQAAPVPEPPPPPAVDAWSASRTKMVQWLWGEGFDFPGGVEFILELVRPLGLRSEHSMLDIGCGVGAATRAIASSFGPWITGLESSPTLVAAGMAASEKAGLAKKAPIERLDLAKPRLPDRRYDGIMSRMVLGAIPDHSQFIVALDKHLKPGGQLMFTEQVLVNADATSPVLDAWHAIEDRTIHAVTLDAITKDLAALKFDVRVAEDMSGTLRSLVVGAWERVANDLKPGMFSADEISHLNHEMELWHRRIAAYDAGLLKFVRVLAIKRG